MLVSPSKPRVPDTLADDITGVLIQEAKERALNRNAIVALRRRALKAGGGKATVGTPRTKKTKEAAAAAAAPNGGTTATHLAKRNARGKSGSLSGGGAADDETSGESGSPTSNPTGDPARGLGWWPPSAQGWRKGRAGHGVPPGVRPTGALPTRLSCGYCRKEFHVQNLDRHENRCPSRNPDLFSTPCVACGLQGPRCACWALRNGLLKEVRTDPKPLFTLFKGNRNDRGCKDGRGVTGNFRRTATTNPASSKAAVGFLGDWTAGEGLRRPAVLAPEKPTPDEERLNMETPEERWRRERDEWLFGRTSRSSPVKSPQRSQLPTPPAPHAPACDPGSNEDATGKGIDKDDQQEESDEAFLVREQMQMRSHFDKVRDAARIRKYAERWFKFSINPPEQIRHQDIPWLPRLSMGLGGGRRGPRGARMQPLYERFETLGVKEGDSSDVKKAALRAASLRWHPDKFMSKYGPRMATEEKAKIANDVQATMQRITKMKERFHQAEESKAIRLFPDGSS